MKSESFKQALLIAGLMLGSYIAGASAPTAHAFEQDNQRLMNKAVSELQGIRKELSVIARNTK